MWMEHITKWRKASNIRNPREMVVSLEVETKVEMKKYQEDFKKIFKAYR